MNLGLGLQILVYRLITGPRLQLKLFLFFLKI